MNLKNNKTIELDKSQQQIFEKRLLKQKLRHKRSLVFLIWAIAFAYLNFSSAETKPLSFLPVDEIDVRPLSDRGFYRRSTANGISSNLMLGVGEDDFHNLDNENENETLIFEDRFNCTPPAIEDFPRDLFTQSERQGGAVAVHFFVSAYIFYMIAIVCDDYFVPSIECICDGLSLPSDVAGATFMAIATSSPELFTNVIGTFITEGDIGLGTIVGSAVFNILAIAACCGLATKNGVQLEWWPLTRDCAFYSVSIILLICSLVNRKVFWYEALVLVCFYFAYIGVMYKNTAFKQAAEKFVFGSGSRKHERRNSHRLSSTEHNQDTEKTPLIGSSRETTVAFTDPLKEGTDEAGNEFELSSEVRDEILIAKALHQSEIHAEEEKEEFGLFKLPWGESLTIWIEWIVGWPLRLVLTITIPDCREQRFRNWYPITFLMCIVWIASLSYVVSWMMTIIGHTFKIPDSVMGLTFIAAGTSVPEAVSSIIVARQGLGAMGISNSIGSNTFDILICLGLPWLIRGSLIATQEVNYILVNSNAMEYSALMLMASLFMFYIVLACNRFVLDKKVSVLALVLYGIFLICSSLIELNVFFPVNLPTCRSDL